MAPHRRRAYLAGLLLTLLTAKSLPTSKLTLHPTRQSPDDLEITGLPGTPAYLS